MIEFTLVLWFTSPLKLGMWGGPCVLGLRPDVNVRVEIPRSIMLKLINQGLTYARNS